jgi:hypothetical protein
MFTKIRAVGAESFHADGWTDGQTDRQTDTTTPIAAFRKFPNAPENEDEKVPRQTERTEMEFRTNKTENIYV